ncbi:hypothetical protein [Lentzea nigeriaca]|uniref:hypothetical protein n=1 Tax=Lentzea nigeriaca TaxID=1128665 RepID=UPI001EF98B22|nr:hypothetical protein [Lentzea nigeriaca]MBM7863110.1 hypothetical protein [Lentzea nigeriaca]
MQRQSLSDDQIDNAERLYEQGWPLARTGNHVDVTADTVRKRLLERGITMRDTQGRPAPRHQPTQVNLDDPLDHPAVNPTRSGHHTRRARRHHHCVRSSTTATRHQGLHQTLFRPA